MTETVNQREGGFSFHPSLYTGQIPRLSTGQIPLFSARKLGDKYCMPDERDILLERIESRLREQGKSAREVSLAATGKPDLIRDLKRRRSIPKAGSLASIADELGTTSDYLLGRTGNPNQVQSEVEFRDVPQPLKDAVTGFHGAPDDRIPVLGTGYCDDWLVQSEEGDEMGIERFMLEVDHVVHMVARPPALFNARDAYAIYFHGGSMEPRFYQGELGIVDPRRPPSPGDFVVVQLNDGESDSVQTVLVKQLVRVAGGYVELRQFNPDTTFRVKRERVARMHRISSNAELFG